MNDADALAQIVVRRAYRAARQNRAFQIGVVSADGGSGSVEVDVPGIGTLSQVGTGVDTPRQVGQQVLLFRVSGDLQHTYAQGRAPYTVGESSTRPFNVTHS